MYKAQNSQVTHKKKKQKTKVLRLARGGSLNWSWKLQLPFLVHRDLIIIGSAASEQRAPQPFLNHSLLHWIHAEDSPRGELCGQNISAASTARLTSGAGSNITNSAFGHQVPRSYSRDLQGPTTVSTHSPLLGPILRFLLKSEVELPDEESELGQLGWSFTGQHLTET